MDYFQNKQMKSGRKNRRRAKQPLRPPSASLRLCHLALAFWRTYQPETEEEEELKRKANRFWKKMQKYLGKKIVNESDDGEKQKNRRRD